MKPVCCHKGSCYGQNIHSGDYFCLCFSTRKELEAENMFFQQHVQTASVLTLGSNFYDVVGVMIMIRNEKHDDSIICTEA